jgi:hypothetical protein
MPQAGSSSEDELMAGEGVQQAKCYAAMTQRESKEREAARRTSGTFPNLAVGEVPTRTACNSSPLPGVGLAEQEGRGPYKKQKQEEHDRCPICRGGWMVHKHRGGRNPDQTWGQAFWERKQGGAGPTGCRQRRGTRQKRKLR